MLSVEYCRKRQGRLLEVMREDRLDAMVLGWSPHVYYFSAHLARWLHESALVLESDGSARLVAANRAPEIAAADEVLTYEAQWMATLRQEQPAEAAGRVLEALGARSARRIGIDASRVSSQVAAGFDGECIPMDRPLWQMRRAKDPDELELLRTAIRCSEAMHARARQIVEPGVEELHVFTELHAAAVKSAGEPLSAPLGNDYACGGGGGPPRAGRTAQAGELYILDLGPAFRGYFADNCRTYSVDRRPTDEQLQAWKNVADSFEIIERMARPGTRCREIFDAVDEHLRSRGAKGMTHHLGHGVGLEPHEYPHLNPRWDDVLMEGEIFSAEPGQYGRELAAGVRLENTYRVTANGVENLLDVPMELA